MPATRAPRECSARPRDLGHRRRGYPYLRDDRSMIGRTLALAWLDVDGASGAFHGEFRRQQDVVDTQPPAALEGHQAVVPPGELLFGLIEKAKRIFQPDIDHLTERGALGLGEMDLSFPALGIVDVARLRRDVEVAEHGEPWTSRQLVAQP